MLADQIRKFVFTKYVIPARHHCAPTVTVRAGDIHSEMGLSSRMPAVCGAIGTKKFEEEYHVRLVSREGPTQGANVYFTVEV